MMPEHNLRGWRGLSNEISTFHTVVTCLRSREKVVQGDTVSGRAETRTQVSRPPAHCSFYHV